MKTKIILSAIAVMTAILFVGCAKDGETGPAGAAGTNGTNGTNGNANVVSATYTLTLWSSIFDTGTEYTYEKSVACTAITQSIYDNYLTVILVDGWRFHIQLLLTDLLIHGIMLSQ